MKNFVFSTLFFFGVVGCGVACGAIINEKKLESSTIFQLGEYECSMIGEPCDEGQMIDLSVFIRRAIEYSERKPVARLCVNEMGKCAWHEIYQENIIDEVDGFVKILKESKFYGESISSRWFSKERLVYAPILSWDEKKKKDIEQKIKSNYFEKLEANK